MGPRAFARGNGKIELVTMTNQMLQWGRALSRAETTD